MNEKETNINDEVLTIKKKILNKKEEEIIKSQTIQNKLEDKIRKLELKKENMLKGNKWLLRNIIYTAVYDVIMITILILFVMCFTNKINLIALLNKTIYVIGLALGVVSISVIGAYISANISDKINHHYKQKKAMKISKLAKKNVNLLREEMNKQESLKKEITNIMNELDSTLENNTTKSKNDYSRYINKDLSDIFEEKKGKSLTKVKVRDE